MGSRRSYYSSSWASRRFRKDNLQCIDNSYKIDSDVRKLTAVSYGTRSVKEGDT